jgi:hypothetical protein
MGLNTYIHGVVYETDREGVLKYQLFYTLKRYTIGISINGQILGD